MLMPSLSPWISPRNLLTAVGKDRYTAISYSVLQLHEQGAHRRTGEILTSILRYLHPRYRYRREASYGRDSQLVSCVGSPAHRTDNELTLPGPVSDGAGDFLAPQWLLSTMPFLPLAAGHDGAEVLCRPSSRASPSSTKILPNAVDLVVRHLFDVLRCC